MLRVVTELADGWSKVILNGHLKNTNCLDHLLVHSLSSLPVGAVVGGALLTTSLKTLSQSNIVFTVEDHAV